MPSDLPRCPQCDARMMPAPDGEALWCQFCGTTRDDPAAQTALAAYRAQTAGQPVDYESPIRDYDMPAIVRRALNEAWHSIQLGELADARYVLEATLEIDPGAADLWYLLSRTTDDRVTRLEYLKQALALEPYHEYAWYDKGVLEDVIPADRDDLPDRDAVDAAAVEAEGDTQQCPLCGGARAFDASIGTLVCQHCGHEAGARPSAGYGGGRDRLEDALLQRRFGYSQAWDIGARVLVCENCHAQLTLSGTTLSTTCPFCDSAQVLVKDVVESFEQPDALLPFQIDRKGAARAVHHRLSPVQVERGDIRGIYLPFWAFDSLLAMQVPLSAIAAQLTLPAGTFGVRDVLVAGVERPPQPVLADLMPYDLHALVRYDPRYLARWSAQIYRVDVVQASITARAYIKHAVRQMASSADVTGPALARTDKTYPTPNTAFWRAARIEEAGSVAYRLLLLPVWMITLYLQNGKRLPAVVNGQTGEAIVSASFSQVDTIIAGPDRTATQELPLAPRPRRNVIRPIAPPPER